MENDQSYCSPRPSRRPTEPPRFVRPKPTNTLTDQQMARVARRLNFDMFDDNQSNISMIDSDNDD
jgi:hypothetical protein